MPLGSRVFDARPILFMVYAKLLEIVIFNTWRLQVNLSSFIVTGSLTLAALLQGFVAFAELHVAGVGPGASFQGNWCEDYTNKTDLYGHDGCTSSISISGTWIAFNKLGPGLQTDINNKYPYTTHNTIIMWSEQGGLDQSGRSYAFVQNNELKGLGYSANGSGPYSSFSLTLRGGGTSTLGS